LAAIILLALLLVPLTCFGAALGDMNNIGKGFESMDYDEVVEFNKKYQKPANSAPLPKPEEDKDEFNNSFTKKEIEDARY